MRNISDNFRRELNENRHLLYFADITLADGKVLHLEKKNFMQSDGFKIDDAVSSSDNLDIGSAIVNQLTLKINNSEEQYSDYDFYGASVVAYTGMDLDGKVEKIRMGTFTVDEAQSTGMLVMLQCLDHMRKFDRPYKKE